MNSKDFKLLKSKLDIKALTKKMDDEAKNINTLLDLSDNKIFYIVESCVNADEEEFKDYEKLVHNKIAPGVRFAVEAGVNEANYDIILITAVDEIFPILAIEKMISHLIKNNLDFLSGTRYSKGGIRLGGSIVGSIFSRTANNLFKLFTNIPLTDCTTGIKMMKKTVWETIKLESKPPESKQPISLSDINRLETDCLRRSLVADRASSYFISLSTL